MDQPDQPHEAATAPRSNGGSFWLGFLAAGIPITLVSLLSLLGNLNPDVAGLIFLWLLGALLWLVAFVAMIGFYVAGRPQTGTGILAALGLGVLVLFTTCFANLSTF